MNTVYYSLRSDPEVFFLFGGYDTRIRKYSENKDRFTKQMLIFGLPLAGGSPFCLALDAAGSGAGRACLTGILKNMTQCVILLDEDEQKNNTRCCTR